MLTRNDYIWMNKNSHIMKKTDKVNYNATMKYANDLILQDHHTSQRTKSSERAFGMVLKICLKTGIRVSDLLNLEYHQFTENKKYSNTYTLTYHITKTSTTNSVPVGAELMMNIEKYRMECLQDHGYTSSNIFFNYQNKKLFSRVWASNKISKANKDGDLGQVLNVVGMHSVRRSAVVEIFEKTQDLALAQSFLGHKNILTTSNYLQDIKTSTQDKLRSVLC